MTNLLERRPILIALAGPNGAGKSSFYSAYLQRSGLRFVNADVLARELNVDPYIAASLASEIRRELTELRESFIFETVFSDPVGDKLDFIKQAEASGYTTLLIFIGLSTPQMSDQRVAMRVSKGGHDVPTEKLMKRFPRVLQNLRRSLMTLENVRIYDNSDLSDPYRLVAQQEAGKPIRLYPPTPAWLKPVLVPHR